MLWKMIGTESIVEIEKNNLRNEKVYNVLLEQEFKDKQKEIGKKCIKSKDFNFNGRRNLDSSRKKLSERRK
jgi:hypothetical protein